MTWQSIECAPRDGTKIIGLEQPFVGNKAWWAIRDVRTIVCVRDRWYALNGNAGFTVAFEPSHWMPRPEDP